MSVGDKSCASVTNTKLLMMFGDITAGQYKCRYKHVNLRQVKSFWMLKAGGSYGYRDNVKSEENSAEVCRGEGIMEGAVPGKGCICQL